MKIGFRFLTKKIESKFATEQYGNAKLTDANNWSSKIL